MVIKNDFQEKFQQTHSHLNYFLKGRLKKQKMKMTEIFHSLFQEKLPTSIKHQKLYIVMLMKTVYLTALTIFMVSSPLIMQMEVNLICLDSVLTTEQNILM